MIAASSGTTFAYTPTIAGVDVVTLTVTNAGGASNSASVVIPVAAAPLALPAAGPFQAGSPASLTLTSPTSGVTFTYTWAVTGQTVPFGLSGTGSSVQFTPTLPGQYLVSATARGSDGSIFAGSQVYTVALAPLAATIFGAPKSGLA